MKLNTMKLYKGERLVTSKFAPVTRKKEFNFGGVIDLKNGKSVLSTVTTRFRIEAINHFEAIAKELGGTLNLKTVREI